MKRNYTLQNPRNRVNNLMTIQENKSLYGRLGSIKSSIDNRAPQQNVHLQLRAKEKINKDIQLKNINNSNEILLERMFSIFTRKRPREKGFNDQGKPFVRSEYDLKTLNLNVRKQENDKICNENSTMLVKLQTAQPRILNKQQWKQHLQNYNAMKRMIRYYGTAKDNDQRIRYSGNESSLLSNGIQDNMDSYGLMNNTINTNSTLNNQKKFIQFSAGGSKLNYNALNRSAYATTSSGGFYKSNNRGMYASQNFQNKGVQQQYFINKNGSNPSQLYGNTNNNIRQMSNRQNQSNNHHQFNNRSMSIDPNTIQFTDEFAYRPQTAAYINNSKNQINRSKGVIISQSKINMNNPIDHQGHEKSTQNLTNEDDNDNDNDYEKDEFYGIEEDVNKKTL